MSSSVSSGRSLWNFNAQCTLIEFQQMRTPQIIPLEVDCMWEMLWGGRRSPLSSRTASKKSEFGPGVEMLV